MVYRVFVEKKEGLDNEAKGLLNEARTLLGMERLENVRLFNRYDAENITEDLFRYAVKTVFSEPQLDVVYDELPKDADHTLAAESKETVSPRKIRSMVSSRMVHFFAILGQDIVLNSFASDFKTARL